MSWLDARTARVLVTVCVFVAGVAFLYGVRHTLTVILFAIFFAYLLEPMVQRIQFSPLARGSRSVAIVEAYIACGGIVTVLLIVFGPRLVADSQHLSQSLPLLLDNLSSGHIVRQVGSQHGWSEDTQRRLQQFVAAHQGDILRWAQAFATAVARSLQNVVFVVLVPILAIFFLKDGKNFSEAILLSIDRRDERRFARGLMQDMNLMVAHFIRAQLILAGISLLLYNIVFELVHLPYALVMALVAGLLEFIPVVGPLVAAAAILGVGFLSGYNHLLFMVLFLAGWRVVQDYVIAPRIMGERLELHPLAAITAVLMGGELGGVLGVYLSIPVAATIRIIWRRWQKYSAALEIVKPRAGNM